MGLVTLFALAGVFVVGSSVGTRGAASALRAAPAWTFLAVSSIGLEVWRAHGHAPAPSLVGNPSQLGGYLVLLLAADVALARATDDETWRAVGLVAALACGVALLFTGSQPAWVGGLVVAVWLVPRHRRVRAALVAVAAGLVLLFAPFSPVGASHTSDAIRGRVEGWRVAVSAIADRPLLGYGPDTGRLALPTHLTERFARDYGVDPLQDRAHDVVLDEAVSSGVLGAAALVALAVTVAKSIRRRDPVANALAGGLVAYGIFLIAWFPTPATAAVALVLAGMASSHPTAVRGTGPPLARTALLGAAAVAVVFGVRTVAADHVLAQRWDAAAADVSPANLAALVPAAHGVPGGLTERIAVADIARRSGSPTLLQSALTLTNDRDDPATLVSDGELEFAFARATRRSSDLAAAATSYRRALAIAPRQSDAWLGLGETLAQTSAHGDARAALERAAALLPRDPAPRVDLAFLALADGDTTTARAEFDAACAIAPTDTQVLDLGKKVASVTGVDATCASP
jgi:Tfp pilus assembly protein PilF